MTVVPLRLDGDHPTVVTSGEIFNIEDSAVLIRNLDRPQLLPEGKDCNTSYDLRVGDVLALDTAVRHSVHSEAGGAFLLTVSLPGSAVLPVRR